MRSRPSFDHRIPAAAAREPATGGTLVVLTSSVPPSAIGAAAPTSRSTFRLLAGCVGATNREADTLRRSLLDRWATGAGTDDLVDRLRSLDRADPEGAQGVEARLAVWFALTEPDDGRLVDENDPVIAGLSDELRTHLAATTRPVPD